MSPDGTSIGLEEIESWIRHYRDEVAKREDELNKLDAAVGDGDCGASILRGLNAVTDSLSGDDFAAMLMGAGMTLVSSMGGTSGPLLGTLFIKMGTTLGPVSSASVSEWAGALRAGVDGIMELGQASPGDKTMIDGLMPAVEFLENCEAETMAEALSGAAAAAKVGAEETIEMAARRGRASYVGGAGVGALDPGAVGMAIMFETMSVAAG